MTKPTEQLWEEDFYEVLHVICSSLTDDSKVARIKKIFEKILAKQKKLRGKNKRSYPCPPTP